MQKCSGAVPCAKAKVRTHLPLLFLKDEGGSGRTSEFCISFSYSVFMCLHSAFDYSLTYSVSLWGKRCVSLVALKLRRPFALSRRSINSSTVSMSQTLLRDARQGRYSIYRTQLQQTSGSRYVALQYTLCCLYTFQLHVVAEGRVPVLFG